jgi:vacuolar-type H+-ATPase subunit E/Vma4
MTANPAVEQADPLAPLVSALLESARRDADADVAGADAEAASMLARARDEANAMLADARSRGAADAAAVVARERSRAEREARGVILAAQRAVHDDARQAARDAVSELRHDPVYPALIDALRAMAQRDHGPTAVVAEHPHGGLVVEIDDRRIEYSLADLADDVMDRMADEMDGLWSP